MSFKAQGQIRQSQIITTYGPGALIDLPRDSAIVGGLETWPKTSDLEEIFEPRLPRKLQTMTGVVAPRLFAPPPDSNDPRENRKGIVAWRFPDWFVVQEIAGGTERERSRRLVRGKSLDDRRRFDTRSVVATRFVRACPKGHVDDLDWRGYVHDPEDGCRRQLWLDERGTSGDGRRANRVWSRSCPSPAATSPICSFDANVASREVSTRRCRSSSIRLVLVADRGRGWDGMLARTARCRAAF